MSTGPEQQYTEGAAGDETTGAIYDVIHTLGSDAQETPPAAMASGESAENTEQLQAGLPLSRGNEELENWLLERGAIARRSPAQRRVLGCVGCKLASQPGKSGTVMSGEIAACGGMENKGVRRILARLVEAGYLTSEIQKQPGAIGRPPELFSLTAKGSKPPFKGRLEAPDECGLESTEGQLRPNARGEEILIENGIIGIRGTVPRAILGCLACKQQTGEGVYVSGIEKCRGVQHGGAVAILKKLADAGVLHKEFEERTIRGGPRAYYQFTGSPLAESIKAALETPPQCGLVEEEQA